MIQIGVKKVGSHLRVWPTINAGPIGSIRPAADPNSPLAEPITGSISPLDANKHMGPLIDKEAVKMYDEAIKKVLKEGGKALVAGGILSGKGYESGCYVKPAIFEVKNEMQIVQDETFAPIFSLPAE